MEEEMKDCLHNDKDQSENNNSTKRLTQQDIPFALKSSPKLILLSVFDPNKRSMEKRKSKGINK